MELKVCFYVGNLGADDIFTTESIGEAAISSYAQKDKHMRNKLVCFTQFSGLVRSVLVCMVGLQPLIKHRAQSLTTVTYIFVVFKTIIGTFPVPWILGKFTGVRTLSYDHPFRKHKLVLLGRQTPRP